MRVERWTGEVHPSPGELERRLAEQGVRSYRWSNGPGYQYAAHSHSFRKILCVLEGSIRFDLPDTGESLWMEAGDRIELPAGISHSALVGPQGVECLEGHVPAQ